MVITKIFEKLATTAHFNIEVSELLAHLPEKFQEAYLLNDTHQLRKLISGTTYFPDTKTVVL